MDSGGGGGGGGVQTRTTETIVPDWVQQQVEQNIATTNQLTAKPYTPYPGGPTVASFNTDQDAAFQQIRDLQGSADPAFNQAIGRISNLPDTIVSLLSPETAGLEASTVSQLQRQGQLAQENTAAGAVAAHALGGTRYGVQQALTDSATEKNIGQAVSQIANTDWTNATNTAFSDAQDQAKLAATGQQAQLQSANALSQVGGQEQALTQAGYDTALKNWQQQQNWPYAQLAISQSALAGSPYGATVQSSQPYTSNTAAEALSLISAGLPIASQLSNWTGLTAAAKSGIASLFAPAAGSTADIGSAIAAQTALAGGGAAELGGVGTASTGLLGFDAAAAGGLETGAGAAAASAAADAAAAGAAEAGAGAAAKGGADLLAAAPLVLV